MIQSPELENREVDLGAAFAPGLLDRSFCNWGPGLKIAVIGSRGLTNAYGGIERVLLQVCPRLAALGHEVDVFGGDIGAEQSFPPGLRHVRAPALNGKYTETLSRSLCGTVSALAGCYDVINLVAIGPGALSPLPRVAGVPVVVSVHGLDWARAKWPRPARFALRTAERTMVRSADQITVVSEQLVSYFHATYDREVIHTPNGVTLRAGAADPALLARMGLEPDGYILFASRLVTEKGAHELIRAFNGVRTGKKLVIAGGDRYDQAYVEALRRIDTTGRCIFVGHLESEALEQIFRGACLYVLPSHVEGLSLSLIEALGYGKPVLVSDIPENLEVAGDCGARFPVGDVEQLAAAIEGLLAAPDRLRDMGRQSRGRAGRLYDWDRVAQRYADSFALACETRAARRRLGLIARAVRLRAGR